MEEKTDESKEEAAQQVAALTEEKETKTEEETAEPSPVASINFGDYRDKVLVSLCYFFSSLLRIIQKI